MPLVQVAERLPGLALLCPAVVRIGVEEELVSLGFGGIGIVTAEDPLRDTGCTIGLDDGRGVLTRPPERGATNATDCRIRMPVDAEPGCHEPCSDRAARRRVNSSRASSNVSNQRSLTLR